MAIDLDYLKSRFDRMLSNASNFRTLQQYIADYFRVSQRNITNVPALGQSQTTQLFSSEPIFALNTLSSFLHASLMPRNAKWAEFEFAEEQINDNDEAADWMSQASKATMRAIQLGNFYPESHKWMHDYVGFGNSPFRTDEGPMPPEGGFGGLLHRCLAPAEYVIAEDAWGRVDTIFRKFTMDARQMVQKATKKENKWDLSSLPSIVIQANKVEPEKVFNILNAIYPRADTEKAPGRQSLPWANVYCMVDEAKITLCDDGEEEFPFAVPRMEQTAGEVWGRGPCYTALPDAKELNRRVELRTQIATKDYLPPLIGKISALVDGKVNNYPSGLTEVDSAYMQIPLQDIVGPLNRGEDYSRMELGEGELIKSIWRIFMVDQILALTTVDNPNETATKTYIRWQIAHQLLGPSGDDFERELGQCLRRSFNILYRANQLPPFPMSLSANPNDPDAKPASLNIRYESPFARSQRSGDIEAAQRWMAWIYGEQGKGGLIEIYPEARFYPDVPKVIKEGAKILGVPAEWIRNQDQIDADVEQSKQQEADDKQKAEMMALAQGIGQAGPGVKALTEAATSAQGVTGGQPAQ